MALELSPTPSCPRPAFSIPFALEHKKFPPAEEMARRPLSRVNLDSPGPYAEIATFWACDYYHLYLAIEVPGRTDSASDQPWKYGDGLVLTVSPQTSDEPVQCYTSLGIAGTTKKAQLLAINRNGIPFPLLDCGKVKYKHQSSTEKSRYFVSIPWTVLQPLRPLIYETIAVNLTFVHKLEQGRALYQLIEDKNFASAKIGQRRLLPVQIFCLDLNRQLAQSFLTRNCWRGDKPLQINLGLFNPETGPAQFEIAIRKGTDTLEKHSSTVELAAGCHHWTIKWSPQRPLPTGEYTLELSGTGGSKSYVKEHDFYLLNPEELASVRRDLLGLEEDIKCVYPAAVHTALANLEWLEAALDECCWEKPDLSGFFTAQKMRDQLKSGANPLCNKPGVSRRAFRSHEDSSLRPYSLYLPKGFNHERKWPLLMLLRADGNDEQKLAADNELHKLADRLGLVLLFPEGRETENYYLDQDEADVLQNLDVVKKNLPIHWDKLFLGGFSRGGFATWHIGLRHPEHFSGLAVISGIPCLPFAQADRPGVTFSPIDYAESAKKLPLLVVHGAQDAVIPPEYVRDIIEALKEKGAELVYKEIAHGGHGNFDWYSPLGAWLKPLLK